MNWQQ